MLFFLVDLGRQPVFTATYVRLTQSNNCLIIHMMCDLVFLVYEKIRVLFW